MGLRNNQNDVIKEEITGFYHTPSISNFLIADIEEFQLPEFTFDSDLPVFKSHTFLGKRMESCFQYIIENSKIYDVVSSNFQIRKGKETIGEIDYLIRSKISSKIIHVELSYKFYLLDPTIDGSQLEQWIGPNRNDSLVKKLNKLKSHQFPLLFSEFTQKHLDTLNLLSENIDQAYCLKAQLFLPFGKEIEIKGLNKDCVAGVWIKLEDFKQLKPCDFCIPEKKNWPISPDVITHHINWFDFEKGIGELEKVIETGLSPMVWLKRNDKVESVFVVGW